MEEQTAVYLLVSSEIQKLLAENDTDVAELLMQQGFDVGRRLAQDPTQVDVTSESREVVTVLIGSAAVIAALTPTISNIVNALTYKSVVVENMELVPVEDSSGNVVRDAHGEPIMEKRRVPRLIESATRPSEQYAMNIRVPAIEISFSSEKNKEV